jgi:hypothetical protein
VFTPDKAHLSTYEGISGWKFEEMLDTVIENYLDDLSVSFDADF